jgi:hypothetical protein
MNLATINGLRAFLIIGCITSKSNSWLLRESVVIYNCSKGKGKEARVKKNLKKVLKSP